MAMHLLEEPLFEEPDEKGRDETVAPVGRLAMAGAREGTGVGQETRPLDLQRGREFLAAAYRKEGEQSAEGGMLDPKLLPDEVVEAVCAILPDLILTHRNRFAPGVKSKLSKYSDRMTTLFAGTKLEDIAKSEKTKNNETKSIDYWLKNFPRRLGQAISWEELTEQPGVKELVTPEILQLGPLDDLKHPIRIFTVRHPGDETLYKGIEIKSHFDFDHKSGD